MFTKVRGPWSALGVMLALIALYLLLAYSDGAAKLISQGTGGLAGIFRVLQARA